MAQGLLFPDPRPLEQRLGAAFFRRAPRRPGVYLMKDAGNNVLYVGKARDLKQRLNNYRVANPDRMPRRHLRMVREVARIEFQFCVDESAALRRESKLLRSLRPRFNRAGVWRGKVRFITWRLNGEELELAVSETPEASWRRFGPLNGGALTLHHALARLLWLAITPKSIAEIPAGWIQGRVPEMVTLHCGGQSEEVLARLENCLWEGSEVFLEWLAVRCMKRKHPFERMVMAGALEAVTDFVRRRDKRRNERYQMSLL